MLTLVELDANTIRYYLRYKRYLKTPVSLDLPFQSLSLKEEMLK